MPTVTTNLTISGDGMPPFALRQAKFTTQPIDASANLYRSVNGELLDLGTAQFRKLALKISCADMQAPAFNTLWPGTALTIESAAEISYKTAGGTPQFTVVAGSSRVEGDYTFYRPQFSVKVTKPWSYDFDEYAAAYSWTLEAEEV